MRLQWDPQKYNTGFTHIDKQHHEMFEGVNGLILFLKQSTPKEDEKNIEKILEMLNFLGEYAQQHFRDEEIIFEEYDHPMKDVNKEEHRLFLEKYVHYQKKLQEKMDQATLFRSVLIQIHIFLQSWLVKHILKVDVSLRECAVHIKEDEYEEVLPEGVFARFLSFFKRDTTAQAAS
uniref:bacteriohemerythrin n=1 Tax=Candidatus Electrothrix sp. TaxID=2170559 RepID=UPI0040560A60